MIKYIFSLCCKIGLKVIDSLALSVKFLVRNITFPKRIFKIFRIFIVHAVYKTYNAYLLIKQKILGPKIDTAATPHLNTSFNAFLNLFGFNIFLVIVIALSAYNFYTANYFSADRLTQNILADLISPDHLETDDNIKIVDISSDHVNYIVVNNNDQQSMANVFEDSQSFVLNEDGNALTRQGFIYPQETKRDIIHYVIVKNDTVASIAYRFGINIETVLVANNLAYGTYLKPGNKLLIMPVSGVSYTVKKNDTLKQIAFIHNSNIDKIISFNKLINERDIVVGQSIIIPGGDVATSMAKRNLQRVARVKSLPYLYQTVKQLGFNLLWPAISTKINQYFTWRHNGLDIHGKTGNPIYASADGTVMQTGWARGYGYQVLIQHRPGFLTRYAHSSKLLVKNRQNVRKGDIIALIGSTGRSTGPHIHYEVIINGRRVNPLSYTRK